MAIQMKIEGLAELSEMIAKLGEDAGKTAAGGLYEGAAVMAGEIKKGAEGILTAPFAYAGGGKTRMPSPEEKDAVLSAGIGIAKFDRNGSEVNTSVGYNGAGYVDTAYGKRKAIAQIANAINSGTSFMKKQPFVRKAANAGAAKAGAAITKYIEAKFNAVTKK